MIYYNIKFKHFVGGKIMILYQNQLTPRVYTQRGLIYMEDVLPTDFVYEFNSGKQLQVLSIHKHLSNKLLEVTFDDGRVQIVDSANIIYNPRHLNGIKEIFHYLPNEKYPYIPCKELDFNTNRPIFGSMPYIAGAFLIYGDTDDPYVNIQHGHYPRTDWMIESNLAASKTMNGRNKTYYENAFTSKPLKWDDLIPEIMLKSDTVCKYIPDTYFYGSIQDRWNLVRGIFDAGYDTYMFPNNVGILHWSESKLIEVKELLLSLGVLSRISTINLDGTHKYRLDVIDNNNLNPKFFYYDKYITHMINVAAHGYLSTFEISHITNISECKYGSVNHRSVIVEITTSQKNAIIIGEHFLPILTQ